MKRCGKCHIEQDLCFFGKDSKRKDGLKPYCSDCRKKESLNYRINNKEKRQKTQKKYKLLNPEYHSKYYVNHKEEIKEYYKNYYETNKEILINKMSQYSSNRRKTDILFNLIHIVRNRVYKIIKVKNINKQNKTFDIVGCSPNQLKEHLQKKFIHGISWDNYGDWHIDHIIPLSSATNEEDIYKLCHYTNLQPLWAEDNLKKSNKIL
jgi:hypothetical protein